MKILIWFLCFLCMIIVKMFIDGTDIALIIADTISPYDMHRRALLSGLLAGIMAVVLFSLTWWCAKKLCSLWDQHSKDKKNKTNNTSLSSHNQRYCRLCGGAIDLHTKKCAQCGKQYFRLPTIKKSKFVPGLVIILLVVIIGLCVCRICQLEAQLSDMSVLVTEQETKITESNETIDRLQNRIAEHSSKVAALTSENNTLKRQSENMEQVYDFCNDHVVVVSDDGTRNYHKCDCPYFDDSYFWAYNTELAEQKGYHPCSYCFDPNSYYSLRKRHLG